MVFTLFAFGVAAAFLISSLVLLNYGRRLGLKYLEQKGADSMAGLPAVEGAVFALIGLLVAFTVSGALHRYDERRQLVLQEANAASTAYDRLGLFEERVARDLRVLTHDLQVVFEGALPREVAVEREVLHLSDLFDHPALHLSHLAPSVAKASSAPPRA